MQMSDAAPPVGREPGGEPEQPTKWPTVFGVIGIILAAFGLLGGCGAVFYPLYFPAYMRWLENSIKMPTEQLDAIRAAQPPVLWMIVGGVVGLVLSSLLLAGSINLVRRRASGPRLCSLWAWTNIPWAVLSFIVQLIIQMKVPVQNQQFGAASKAMGIAFASCWTIVVGIGLPILLLWWFARGRIKEEITSWADESRALI